jgi:hypothetical protein
VENLGAELAELERLERASVVPRWDFDTLTLWYEDTVCRHYKRRNAENQFAILEAFHTAEWARSVESPFGVDDRTLRETVDELNKGLDKASPMRFGIVKRRPVWIPPVAPACSG